MTKSQGLVSYRPCAGVMLFNREGRVFLGRRVIKLNKTQSDGRWWHMPQGGIEDGEPPERAALRELWEETAVSSVEIIAEFEGWLYYDLPFHLQGRVWEGRYSGQRQKWFAARFLGSDGEINIHRFSDGHPPEFVEWSWVTLDSLLDLAVPFKREVYRRVIAAFAHLSISQRSCTVVRK